MKICPKCNKANPDNSKKCFYCQEDLSEIMPYVPEPEPEVPNPEEEIDDLDDEDFEEEEPQDAVSEEPTPQETPKLKREIKLWTPQETVAKLFPLSSIIVFLLTVFVTVCIVTNYYMEEDLMKGIILGGIVFIIGLLLSLILIWMNAIISIFSKPKDNEANTEEEEEEQVSSTSQETEEENIEN